MAVITGTPASEALIGTAFADKIHGRGGNDRFRGLAGDDLLAGAAGRDWFEGGAGNDHIRADGGADRAFGGGGADRIELGAGNDLGSGQDGDDMLFGGLGDDLLRLGAGDDWADGGEGADTITGAGGRDRIHGGRGADLIGGGEGDDLVLGQDGDDQLRGDAGDDRLGGGLGDDRLFGGRGSDRLNGGDGDDQLQGDRTLAFQVRAMIDGRDLLLIDGDSLRWHHLDFAAVGRHEGLDEPTLVSTFEDGVLRLDRVEWTPEWSAPPPDEIRQEEFSSIFQGLDPQLPDGPVDAVLEVLAAREQVSLRELPSPDNGFTLTLEFDDNAPGGHAWYEARVTVFDHVGSPDILLGGAGDDLLRGGGGADHLEGQAGRDTLHGGADADRFVYRAAADSPADGRHDVIEDFRRAQGDKVDLSAIDADATRPGNQRFTWIGTAPLTAPGQLHVDFSADEPIVEGSTTGAAPDLRIHLRGLFDVTGGDFIL